MLSNFLPRLSRALNTYRDNLRLISRNARLFLIGTFFMGMGFSGFMLLFNLYLKSIGLPENRIGNVITATTIGTLIMALPASIVIRRVSIKRILILSTPVALFSYLIQVMTFNYYLIMAAGLFSGLAMVFFQIAAAPFFMRHSTPRERPYLFSLNYAAALVAGVLGSVVGGFLPGVIEKFGLVPYLAFRYTLIIFGGLILTAVVPYVMIRDTAETRDDQAFFNLVTSRSVIVKLFLPNLATGLGAGLSIPFINLYFKNALHMPTRSIGIYYGLSQILMISGVLLAPIFAERIGKIRTVVFSQLISIPFLVLMGITRSPLVAVFSFLIRAALMNMAQPLFTNYAMEKVRHDEQALTNALLVIAWTAGRGLSASIGGLLIVRFSYAIPFFATSFLYLVSSILMFAFFKDQRPVVE